MTPQKRILFITIFFIISIPLLLIGLTRFSSKNMPEGRIEVATPTAQNTQINTIEKQKIDTWIQKNNLNDYGDPLGTSYAGGTPLFNEATGQTIDKYDYIQTHHVDKPWNK